MNSGIDDRAPMAKAMSKVSEIIAICLMMIVPALIGIWLDRTFSTVPLLTLIGLVFGMSGAILQLMRLVSPKKKLNGQSLGGSEPNPGQPNEKQNSDLRND